MKKIYNMPYGPGNGLPNFKGLYFLCLLFLSAVGANAQVGIGTVTPDASAQLEVSSTNKGMLTPRMTLAQRNAVVGPVEGLLIYQTDSTPGFYYYNGTAWTPFVSTVNSGGSIIPFASGIPAVLTTLVGGLAGTNTLIGFGSSVAGVSLTGTTIDLTGAGGTLLNFAFSSPRSGTIDAISGFFSTTVALTLFGGDLTVQARLYRCTTPNNIFTPVDGAVVSFPPLSGIVTIGETRNAITTGLNIPVNPQDRFLLVFSCSSAGMALANTIVGYASAGLSIR